MDAFGLGSFVLLRTDRVEIADREFELRKSSSLIVIDGLRVFGNVLQNDRKLFKARWPVQKELSPDLGDVRGQAAAI
jgi:hypothetical protein